MEIVYVRWVDSHGWSTWNDARTRIKTGLEQNLMCETVGFLIAESDDRLVVASSISLDEETTFDNLTDMEVIPRVAVLEMEVLREIDREPS